MEANRRIKNIYIFNIVYKYQKSEWIYDFMVR